MSGCASFVIDLYNSTTYFNCGLVDDQLSDCSIEGAKNECCLCNSLCCDVCVAIREDRFLEQIISFYNCPEGGSIVQVVVGILVLFFLLVYAVVRIYRSSRRETERRSRHLAALQQAVASRTSPLDPNARLEEIRSKFHFQTVRKDMSNTNSETLRSPELVNTLATDEKGEDQQNESSTYSSVFQKFSYTWRNQPLEECCICLDGYHPGVSICAAKTAKCDHVFHQDCVVEWLQTHDKCPLCRVDLMNEPNDEAI